MSENDQVRIAKITAKQAVIVALITSVAGLAGVLIQKFAFGNNESNIIQNEIRFRGIEFRTADITRYRVIMEVDGVPYSYPGQSVWKEVGPKIPEQSFPLYSGLSQHSVTVEVFAETRDGSIISAISEQGKSLSAGSDISIFRVVERGGVSRSGIAFATVEIEIIAK